MITDCINFIKAKLAEVGIAKIYDDESSESAFKNGTYAAIIRQTEEPLEYDGSKVAYTDVFDKGVRIYHIRMYMHRLTLLVRFAATSEALAEINREKFLLKLGTGFADREDYRIEVEGARAGHVTDKSILGTGAMKDAALTFTGGIYVQKVVRLLTDVDTGGEIIIPNREGT